jgi:hypothetical protein
MVIILIYCVLGQFVHLKKSSLQCLFLCPQFSFSLLILLKKHIWICNFKAGTRTFHCFNSDINIREAQWHKGTPLILLMQWLRRQIQRPTVNSRLRQARKLEWQTRGFRYSCFILHQENVKSQCFCGDSVILPSTPLHPTNVPWLYHHYWYPSCVPWKPSGSPYLSPQGRKKTTSCLLALRKVTNCKSAYRW